MKRVVDDNISPFSLIQRSEKAKEFELFTVKVDKLETLCRALQEERKGLYDKIRGIRFDMSQAVVAEELALHSPEEIPTLGLTAEMERLNAEQARLKEFAASLVSSDPKELEDSDDEEEPTQGPVKLPSVPEEPSDASPENKTATSVPCHQESKPEQIQAVTVASETVHPTEQGAVPAQELPRETSKPEELPRETSKAEEPKAEVPAPEPMKQEQKDTEKDCEHHTKAEVDLSKEVKAEVVPVVEVDAKQQQAPNSQPVQEGSTDVPKEAENAKTPEAKGGADKAQPGKQERKKSKAPKEKPVVEGAAQTEAAAPSQAQAQTSQKLPSRSQGKKQGANKKKNQSKNGKK